MRSIMYVVVSHPQLAKLCRDVVKAEPDATREWLNKRSAATRSFMMNCVKQLNVYQRRTSIPTRNFTILHHIILVRFVVDMLKCLTDGARSAVIPQAGIMEVAALNGFPRGKKLRLRCFQPQAAPMGLHGTLRITNLVRDIG